MNDIDFSKVIIENKSETDCYRGCGSDYDYYTVYSYGENKEILSANSPTASARITENNLGYLIGQKITHPLRVKMFKENKKLFNLIADMHEELKQMAIEECWPGYNEQLDALRLEVAEKADAYKDLHNQIFGYRPKLFI